MVLCRTIDITKYLPNYFTTYESIFFGTYLIVKVVGEINTKEEMDKLKNKIFDDFLKYLTTVGREDYEKILNKYIRVTRKEYMLERRKKRLRRIDTSKTLEPPIDSVLDDVKRHLNDLSSYWSSIRSSIEHYLESVVYIVNDDEIFAVNVAEVDESSVNLVNEFFIEELDEKNKQIVKIQRIKNIMKWVEENFSEELEKQEEYVRRDNVNSEKKRRVYSINYDSDLIREARERLSKGG